MCNSKSSKRKHMTTWNWLRKKQSEMNSKKVDAEYTESVESKTLCHLCKSFYIFSAFDLRSFSWIGHIKCFTKWFVCFGTCVRLSCALNYLGDWKKEVRTCAYWMKNEVNKDFSEIDEGQNTTKKKTRGRKKQRNRQEKVEGLQRKTTNRAHNTDSTKVKFKFYFLFSYFLFLYSATFFACRCCQVDEAKEVVK